jgi:phosphate transport system ATP-binding protein
MNRLCDLVPETRVDGRVFYQDLDIYSVDVDPLGLRRRIGMIFQKPNPFPLSIRANLELPLKEHGFRDREERGALMETSLREAGLWNEVKDRLRSPATSLSGGQQQRLCIARAIAMKPHVLLMDEPCSALDPISGGAVEQLIEKLGEHYTVVLVTHHLAQARRLSSRTAMLWPEAGAGRLIEFGPTARLFSDPQHPTTAAYLEGREG